MIDLGYRTDLALHQFWASQNYAKIDLAAKTWLVSSSQMGLKCMSLVLMHGVCGLIRDQINHPANVNELPH